MDDLIIDFQGVDVYQKDLHVLSDVNFQVKRGELVYLIGRVGSGKSSLIKTLNGELPIKRGNARVLDFNLSKLKHSQIHLLRRRLGVVFQDFQLLTDRSVYQNLLFVLRATGWTSKQDMDARIEEVLHRVELLDKKESMPHRLSGGEQQRVSIARALLNSPELILADEPTGNLDPETTNNVMDLIWNISRSEKLTVLIATHNYNILKNFPSRIMKCEDQKLVQSVMPSEQDLREKLIKFGIAKGYEYELVYETVMKMYGHI